MAIPGTGPVNLLPGVTECIKRASDVFAKQVERLLAYINTQPRNGISSDTLGSLGDRTKPVTQLGKTDHQRQTATPAKTEPANGASTQHYRERISEGRHRVDSAVDS